jgi:hypothetical protein
VTLDEQPSNSALRNALHRARRAESTRDPAHARLRQLRAMRSTWFDAEIALRREIDDFLGTNHAWPFPTLGPV